MKKCFLDETWLNITCSQVPSPGVVWTWVSRVLCVCCCVCLSVCACSVWLSCAHICCWQGLASGADVPYCGTHLLGDHTPSARVCASCLLPMARAHSRDHCWSHGSVTRLTGWRCSWAASGIAGLSWRLLLCLLCCFRHYLWLTWRNNTAVLQEEAVNYVLNIQTVLWAWEVKAWHNLSSWPLYFTLLLQ